jgi:hypothetical protein
MQRSPMSIGTTSDSISRHYPLQHAFNAPSSFIVGNPLAHNDYETPQSKIHFFLFAQHVKTLSRLPTISASATNDRAYATVTTNLSPRSPTTSLTIQH